MMPTLSSLAAPGDDLWTHPVVLPVMIKLALWKFWVSEKQSIIIRPISNIVLKTLHVSQIRHWKCCLQNSSHFVSASMCYLNWTHPKLVSIHIFYLQSISSLKSNHCGLVTPYGDIELGAWWHQASTWTNCNVDFHFKLVRLCAFTWEQFRSKCPSLSSVH